MTTLIVGCGYLGRRVGARLARRGERLLGTTRSAERAPTLANLGIEPVIADVLDPGSLAGWPEADRVLYCVGFDRSAGVAMRTAYVEGLRHALDRLAGRAGRLVYVGSTGVYGQTGGEWVDEASPTEPTHEAGRVALDAERLARRVGDQRGLPVVVVRYSGLYGPGRIVRRASLERGEPITGDPARSLNLIHIDDAAEAAIAALDRGAPGEVYLASDDRPVARGEYYTLAARLVHAPAPRFEIPAPGTSEAGRDASNKRVSNRRMREALRVSLRFPDITTGLPAAIRAESGDRATENHASHDSWAVVPRLHSEWGSENVSDGRPGPGRDAEGAERPCKVPTDNLGESAAMANASFEKAMKLAVVTGLRSMLGPALLARTTDRPDRTNWALAAIGELVVDKLPLIPSRDTLLPLLVRGIAGAWVAKTVMEEEGVEEPWAMPLGAAVAMGVAVAAPKIRTTLGWSTGVPDPLLGLVEDYLALRLGTEAVGLSLGEVAQVAKDTVEELTSRVQAALPTTQSVGAGSM